jgi:hypothetical protein
MTHKNVKGLMTRKEINQKTYSASVIEMPVVF